MNISYIIHRNVRGRTSRHPVRLFERQAGGFSERNRSTTTPSGQHQDKQVRQADGRQDTIRSTGNAVCPAGYQEINDTRVQRYTALYWTAARLRRCPTAHSPYIMPHSAPQRGPDIHNVRLCLFRSAFEWSWVLSFLVQWRHLCSYSSLKQAPLRVWDKTILLITTKDERMKFIIENTLNFVSLIWISIMTVNLLFGSRRPGYVSRPGSSRDKRAIERTMCVMKRPYSQLAA